MNEYIAYGGGVGSTDLILKNLKKIQNGDLEIVFVNHYSDLPGTYEYVKNIKNEIDVDVTELKVDNLFDFCWYHKILPSIYWRWCTDKFKIRPMKKYVGGDVPLLGITLDERRRTFGFNFNKARYPLIELGITRFKALDDFKDVSIPCKSGCFFCPYQKKEQWRKLYFEYPYLFLKALLLENRCRERKPDMWLYPGLLKNLDREFKEQTLLEV